MGNTAYLLNLGLLQWNCIFPKQTAINIMKRTANILSSEENEFYKNC